MKTIKKIVTNEIKFYIDGNFEIEYNEFFELLCELSYDDLIITNDYIEKYLLEKEVIKETTTIHRGRFAKCHRTTDKFNDFFDKVGEL